MTKWGAALEDLRKRWNSDRNSIGELCRRAGIERSEYFRICHKSKFGPSVQKVMDLLMAMGYGWQDWAEAIQGKAQRPAFHIAEEKSNYQTDNLAMIPLLDVKLAAGAGAVEEGEKVLDELAFKRTWIKTKLKANIADLRLLQVKRDSMEPTLCDGDLVMVDLSKKTIRHDQVYALREGEERIVKRLCMKGEGIVEICSDNPRHERRTVRAADVEIIGKVVWMAGRRA